MRWRSPGPLGFVLCSAFAVAALVGWFQDGRTELVGGRGRASLAADIARLDEQLGLPVQTRMVSSHSREQVAAPLAKGGNVGAKKVILLPRRARGGMKQKALAIAQALVDTEEDKGEEEGKHAWDAKDQEKYDTAVNHAQIAETGMPEVYHPLHEVHSFTRDAAKENERFEGQLTHLIKQLEPAYLSEALEWAANGDTDDNTMIRPIVEALESPLIKDLDDEARIRVVHAVDALSKKHDLSLAEGEQLRAHLMAPLLVRIRKRVHKQVTEYVVKTARSVILKAANASYPGGQRMAAGFVGAAKSEGFVLPQIPKLTDADLKFVNAMHDVDGVYKAGVVDRKGYETQRAKLLTDWLKYTVNQAGGNANEVLKMLLGGSVRGITDTGIRNPSPISVHKKLEMEKGIASMSGDREQRMTRDLVYKLVHGTTQWGDLSGCDEDFSSERCAHAWDQIRHLIQQYARPDDPELYWGPDRPESEAQVSPGTKALVKHLSRKDKNSATDFFSDWF